jgi:hypothetical protein
MERLTRGSKEWYLEVTTLSELLRRWSAAPDDEVIQIAILESMEKLGLVVKSEA